MLRYHNGRLSIVWWLQYHLRTAEVLFTMCCAMVCCCCAASVSYDKPLPPFSDRGVTPKKAELVLDAQEANAGFFQGLAGGASRCYCCGPCFMFQSAKLFRSTAHRHS